LSVHPDKKKGKFLEKKKKDFSRFQRLRAKSECDRVTLCLVERGWETSLHWSNKNARESL